MSAEINCNVNGCNFLSKIENLRYCCLKRGEIMKRSAFIANAVEDTKWSLLLIPVGHTDEKYIDCCLYREADCSGPEVIEVNYKISFLDKDGSPLIERIKLNHNFKKGRHLGFLQLLERKTVFDKKPEEYFHEDTLTVQCAIWKKGQTPPLKTELIFGRSVCKVTRRSFVWCIDEFSSVSSGLRNKILDDSIHFDIIFCEEPDLVKKLNIDIISFNKSIKYFSFRISILNSKDEKVECGAIELNDGEFKKGVLSMPLFSKILTENKSSCLKNDILLLDCEYSFSDGTVLHEIFKRGITFLKEKKMVIERDASQLEPVLVDDLNSVLNDGIFSDVKLCTPTQTFPVHKIFLAARSPVFRRMFSSDMKENGSGHVDIADLEDDTVRQMLLYIYTDTLEDLQMENACKLYTAADKYEILSLKNKCSFFMKKNLSPTKVCDVLVLADLHQDSNLKSSAEDYILNHEKECFRSQEWKDFMATNLKLAADIMYRRVFSG